MGDNNFQDCVKTAFQSFKYLLSAYYTMDAVLDAENKGQDFALYHLTVNKRIKVCKCSKLDKSQEDKTKLKGTESNEGAIFKGMFKKEEIDS